MAPHPPDPLGLLLPATIATVVVTSALSLLVLWHHRRAVGRAIRTRATSRPVVPVPVGGPAASDHRARPAPVVVLGTARRHAAPGPANDLWRRARRHLHATVAAYIVAGLTCGLVDGAVWLMAGRVEIGPRNLLGLAVLFAWPLVPTVLAVLAAPRSTCVRAWVGYGALVPVSTIGTGIAPAVTAMLVGVVVLPPAVVLLALSGRDVRAVGPFLAVPVLVTATGLLLSPSTAQWAVRFGTSPDVGTALAVLAAGVLGVAGTAHLVRSARQYARKRAGDQMVTISHWWLLATVWHSVVLIPSGIRPAVAVWTAHLAFRLVLAAALRLRPRPTDLPRRLLLLRTPGAPQYSETLLGRLGAYWRYVGPIATITRTDLASAALEPHEFLDLLRGWPARRIISSAGEVRKRVDDLDGDPDPDGRYRVGELFCRDDLCRPALQQLLRRSDCILLDLRGFTRRHERVTDEITQLAQLVPLGRILVLVDDDTDQYVLRATVDRAHRGSGGSLRLMRTGGGHLDIATVVEQLAAASARTA
jgi:hypothetical protein